ncbi:MAG TPA: DUF1097 family protein [Candidatus Limnocylindrales bacterium]|jgi:hypothetical protein
MQADSAPLATPPTIDRVPLWLASSITVVVSLPFGLWLGDFNLPLWVAFIVWAEYFQLGAKPVVLRTIIPAYLIGVAGATSITTANALLERVIPDLTIVSRGDVAAFVSFFAGFCVLIYAMRWMGPTRTGTLPFFNGISMTLGVLFTGAFETAVGPDVDAVLLPAVAGIGAALAGLLGAALGWFNVAIMFTRPAPGAMLDRRHLTA